MALTDLCRSQLNDKNNDFPFYNYKTRSVDCNVAMTSQCVELVTGAKLSSKKVRELGEDLVGGSGSIMARKVFQSQGMVANVDYVFFKGQPTTTVRDLLRDGWFVVGYVMYGSILDSGTGLIGSKTYRGAHAIGMSDWWRKGERMLHEHDPLFDGRYAWVPKGRQNAPFRILRDAMWAYAGEGLVSGYAVKPK